MEGEKYGEIIGFSKNHIDVEVQSVVAPPWHLTERLLRGI